MTLIGESISRTDGRAKATGEAVYGAGRGPVHVNCMFREPLSPDPTRAVDDGYTSTIASWLETDAPYTDLCVSDHRISETDAAALNRRCR